MSNATVSRLGQIQGAGDSVALFLKKFAGEVLTTFEEIVLLKELTKTRSIESGKSASFPAMYKASGGYHTPGTEIVGKVVQHNEVIITIDDLLLSDVFIANIDEAMNHYDVRSTYSTEMGRYLASQYDRNIARNIIRAARGPALFAGDQGGSTLSKGATGLDTAGELVSAVYEAKQTMEEKDVPVDMVQVNAAFKPAEWYLLAQDKDQIQNRDVGGDGSVAQGQFKLIGGANIIKSNAFPWGVNDTANTDIPADYRVDMTNTVGTVFTESAAATVQLMGLAMESDYDIRRQGTLMVGKYAVGHGSLVNKCAVELSKAA